MNKFNNRNGTKYNSKKTIIDWIKFDSQLEWKFYSFLNNHKDITLLERQTPFILMDKFRTKEWEAIRAIIYKCDFYIEYQWDKYYIDSKWNQDSVFKIKHKLWLRRYWEDNILIVCKSIKELCTRLWINYESLK
jgi:hypothetical protein